MIEENETVIDLEEAVGSYLNCLSTSCAAGSKLYTSVGKIIDEKFHEIFPDQELNNQLVKTCFQSLQVQNAFEGYQKALLECKEKLLEILIDNHTNKKQQQPKDSKNKKENSTEEKYAAVALIVAKELYCYHQTVAEVLKPLLFSDFQEDFENATLTSIDGKDDIVTAWCTVSEANKVLRQGYGLTNSEISQILSWQHGADLSESCRKRLNQKINTLIQQYVDNFYTSAACEEISIPLAFSRYPEDIEKLLQNCCSPSEAIAASAQGIPVVKEEIEVMLHRELPRVSICLNGRFYDKASPGKAFENTTLKMRAIREIISNLVEVKQIDATKEQIDLFCLRVLATSSCTISYASSRTAVILAFGKRNLVKVKPPLMNDDGEKVVYFNIQKDVIEIDIQSKWCITEDSTLFASLCRDNALRPIAIVDVSYHALINIEEYLVNRIEPTPIAHITQCVLRQSPTAQQKKDHGRERSKSIKIKLTKATTKLFHRKSVLKSDSDSAIITNEYINENDATKQTDRSDILGNSSCDSENEAHPVPPPRTKRKAKKSRKEKCDTLLKEEKERKEKKEKKEDLEWYSSSPKFGIPPVPTISGSKDFSPSVASFEELQGVIDFLSGSSSSSLAVNEKGEKIRTPYKSHKRNNSTTSLQSESKLSKITPEGKLKLCHKKSASFSGETTEMKTKELKEEITENAQPIVSEKAASEIKECATDDKKDQTVDVSFKKDGVITNLVAGIPSERTPGDGMDDRIDDKAVSVINIVSTVDEDKGDVEKDLDDVSNPLKVQTITQVVQDITALTASIDEVSLCDDIKLNNKNNDDEKVVEKPKEPENIQNEISSNETKTNELDKVTRNIFAPLNSKNISLSSDIVQPTHPTHVNRDILKSEPSNLNALPNDLPSYLFQTSIANNKMSNTEHDMMSNMPNHMNDSIPSNKAPGGGESERASPMQREHHGESELALPYRFPSDLERSIQNSKTLQELERNLQARIPTRSGRNTPTRASSDSDRSSSKITSPVNDLDVQPEGINQQILYEPFNSKWSVALGQNKSASWSDATFDSECMTTKNDNHLIHHNKPGESEFTLDKQMDFNKLLEGSKFFAGHTTKNENWRDRSYMPNGGQNSFDAMHDAFSSMPSMPRQHQQMPSKDPWPLQSNSHTARSSSYSPFPPMSSGSHQVMKRSIEGLQLPPNPVGPYMRQNREQLLAKQQILEQYARHQKQLQIQQQQQHHQQHHQKQQQQQQMPGLKSLSNPSMTPPPTSSLSSNSNFRMPPSSHNHSAVDRSMSLPPGFSMSDRLNNTQSQRYDPLPERSSYRPLSMQRSGPSNATSNQYLFGNNQFSGMQSRSVNDIRMENANMLSEKPSFSQMSEQNIFMDQYNQAPDSFSARY